MSKADAVRKLIEKHFWKMPDDASLSTGDTVVLPEEAFDFFEEYFETLNINPTGFNFRAYFPREGIRFLPNALLPEYLKTDSHQPAPVTIKMLIDSAEAGRWLFGEG